MGRRKSSSLGGSEADSESVASERGSSLKTSARGGRGRPGDDSDYEELEVDPFDAAVEQLYEKRASTREAALSSLVSLLAQFRYDDCAFREDTLSHLFLSSVRRGKEAEAVLAARALGLHVTTLGASTASEGIYQEAEPLLEPLVLTHKHPAVRGAVVELLSMLCFVGSEGAAETLHTMSTLWRVVLGGWKQAAWAAVVVAALRGWAFLLTTVPRHRLDAHFVETHLGLLAQLLNGGDVEVRGAAGEAIALLWEMGELNSLPESPRPGARGTHFSNTLSSLAAGTPPSSPAFNRAAAGAAAGAAFGRAAGGAANGAAAATAANGSAAQPPAAAQQQGEAAAAQQQTAAPPAAAPAAEEAGYDEGGDDDEEEGVDSLEAIVERMRDLAKNRGDASRKSKGERATSRGTFRDLLAILEGEYVPEQKVKLRHGDQLVVSGLPDNIRLNYLRAYLADAFQSHLQRNELLHEVFRFTPAEEPEERLTPLEKRMLRSKSSTDVRDRHEQRKKERATMASYRHGGSLADYGE